MAVTIKADGRVIYTVDVQINAATFTGLSYQGIFIFDQ
jgi:hypothetical protein